MLVPVVFLFAHSWFLTAAFLVFVHDMLDRLDGAVARHRKSKEHNPRLGAFLDAQGDKLFHVGFLGSALYMYSSQLGMYYFITAVLLVIVHSISFFVRCLDFFVPVNEGPDGLKAAGEGKLATTMCNSAALFACLMMKYNSSSLHVLTVVMLYISLDLAIRSVKLKLFKRVGALSSFSLFEDGEETLFYLVSLWQRLHYIVAEYPVIWMLQRNVIQSLPGKVNVYGSDIALVFLLQGACNALALPLLFSMKHGFYFVSVLIIMSYHYALQTCQVLSNHHIQTKAINYYLFNLSQFVHYVCLRIFGLTTLWMVWSISNMHKWSWSDYFLVNVLLICYFFYGISLLLIRIDDTMPHHPATVASWARIGGPGVASGVSTWGIIRERLQPFALVFTTLTLMDDGIFSSWYGYAALVCDGAIITLNHKDLVGKLRVRSATQKHKASSLNELVEQDASLSQERKDDPPFDVVVTIGCFDLFHEGHIKLMQRMRTHGRKLLVGLHDDESINLLKGRFPVDNVVKRLQNVKKYADQVFVIPSTDPSPYLDGAVDRSIPKEKMCFIRGADMPKFPGRSIAEQVMEIKLLPYTEGVSSTMLRKKLTERVEGQDYGFSGGNLIWFQGTWINIASEPPGTGWVQYGSDYFRFRTSESSPTIW